MRTYKIKHVTPPESGDQFWTCNNCDAQHHGHEARLDVREVDFSDTDGTAGSALLCAETCLLQFLDAANTARSALRAVEMYLSPGVVTHEEIVREIEKLQRSHYDIPDGEVVH